MSLIRIVNSNRLLVRQNLAQLFRFWFEENFISLNNDFKHQRKIDDGVKSNQVKEMFKT